MAPKKKTQNKNNTKASSISKAKSQSSSSSSSVPRLQISSENENRLRRLLIKSGRPAQQAATPAVEEITLSKSQKAKKLKAVYEKLSCEGFSNDQIELAISSLKDKATFEDALDWLCLNFPSNELPSKFSSGTSMHNEGGSVNVISTAREDWTPSSEPSSKSNGEVQVISVRTKGHRYDDSLDSFQPSQADWIRQYVEQHEEDETGTWEDDAFYHRVTSEVSEPRSYDDVAKEYLAARLEATKAKEKGDKKRQEEASHIIRKLKQELSALGLSDDLLANNFANELASANTSARLIPCEHSEEATSDAAEADSALTVLADDLVIDGNDLECCSSKEFQESPNPPLPQKVISEESADVELGDLFSEDASLNEPSTSQVMKLQKKEKMKELCSEKNLGKLNGIWKKPGKQVIAQVVVAIEQFRVVGSV